MVPASYTTGNVRTFVVCCVCLNAPLDPRPTTGGLFIGAAATTERRS